MHSRCGRTGRERERKRGRERERESSRRQKGRELAKTERERERGRQRERARKHRERERERETGDGEPYPRLIWYYSTTGYSSQLNLNLFNSLYSHATSETFFIGLTKKNFLFVCTCGRWSRPWKLARAAARAERITRKRMRKEGKRKKIDFARGEKEFEREGGERKRAKMSS